VKARKGNALLFFSMKPDGSFDGASLHSGCPVIRGEKWSADQMDTQRVRDSRVQYYVMLQGIEDGMCLRCMLLRRVLHVYASTGFTELRSRVYCSVASA